MGPPLDPVEAALTSALTAASAAGEWATVGELARALEARRAATIANVIAIDRARRGRS